MRNMYTTKQINLVLDIAIHIFYTLYFLIHQVSKVVEEREQGEAQGALNGIKALTEGFGPLLFGGLMALFEG